MSEGISDQALIEQALAGRQSAYSTLVKRYERLVFTLALRFVKNREDAHEVAQDAFLRAFRYLPDFRGESKFSTWLYKIVYTTALNHLRKAKPQWYTIDDPEHPIAFVQGNGADAAAQLEMSERNTEIKKAIQQLSPDDAGIITLFYLFEHNLEEICAIMDLSMANAKTKLCRARQRLKTIVQEKHFELSL